MRGRTKANGSYEAMTSWDIYFSFLPMNLNPLHVCKMILDSFYFI